MEKLLELLERDCTQTPEQLSAQSGLTLEEVRREQKRLEDEGVILGYKAIVDWDRASREAVTALIEVESMYLMSGSFDLTVIISGRTLREVAQFVGERLAPLEGVTGTATHFILKKYKEKHLVFRPEKPQEREFIFT